MNVVGTVVAQRYELKKIIGQGGQGIVCRALDRKTGRAVAVKMLTGADAHKPEYAARLAREQQAMIALAGTSAVAVLDLCKAPNGSLCLVMELLEGVDLEEHFESLENRGMRMALQALYDVFDPIVDTLERAHDAGILHRDLKPGNIFLIAERAGGGVRLLDFGLSRMKTDAPLTEVGTVLGSPSYIAPEAWRGQPDAVDHRADVYSFSVLVFRALTGQLPFQGATLYEKFKLATTAPRPSLVALRPDLPIEVDAWAAHALAIDRDQRFAGIRASWRALFKALRYTPTPRMIRPVADSLINAWRAATTAFRRFIEPPTPAAPPNPGPLIASAVVDVGEVARRPGRPGSATAPESGPGVTAPSEPNPSSDRASRPGMATSSSVFPRPEELVDDDDWIDEGDVELLEEESPVSSRAETSGPRSLIDEWLSSAPPARGSSRPPEPTERRPESAAPAVPVPEHHGASGPANAASTDPTDTSQTRPGDARGQNHSVEVPPASAPASGPAGQAKQRDSESRTEQQSETKARRTQKARPRRSGARSVKTEAKKAPAKKKASAKKSTKKKSSRKKPKTQTKRAKKSKKANKRSTKATE